MRRTLPLLAALLLPTPLWAQADTGTNTALVLVSKRGTVAEWLVRYDAAAWISSDSVVLEPDSLKAALGAEWFVDTADGLWHAYYGKYDPASRTYSIAFHYAGRTARSLRGSVAPIDTAAVTASARALYQSSARLPLTFAPPGLRFNQFVRRSPGDTLEVWLLPAFQPNGVLVYGREAVYRWDKAGNRLLDSTLVAGPYRGFRPDTTHSATLAGEYVEYPTVGQLFFLLAYSRYFSKLAVRTQRYYTTLFEGEGGPAFISVLRDSTAQ